MLAAGRHRESSVEHLAQVLTGLNILECVQEGPVDFTETQVQQQMTDSLQLFRDNEFVVGGTLSSWWDTLLDTSNATTPGVRLTLHYY